MNIEIAPKEYDRKLNWPDAQLYCQLLDIDGKMAWRLPTKDELDYIINSKNDFVGSFYWSATEYDDDSVWFQGLMYGNKNYISKNDINHVRPIRSLSR